MPKTKQQKQEILNQLAENFNMQKAFVFIDYKGLKVGDMTTLRSQLREAGSRLVVAKKTLFSKVLKEKGIEADLKGIDGQIGAIFAFEDPMAPLRVTSAFTKANEHVKIVGGYFENELQSASSMVAIANLPSKEELLAHLLSTMAAPMSGLATVLQGNIKGLITVLSKIKT